MAKDSEGRSDKGTKEVSGILLIALSIFLFLCLFTYSPEDPSFSTFSTRVTIRNGAGIVGAYLSDILIQVFGLVAYLLPFLSLLYGWKEFKGTADDRLFRIRVTGAIIFLLSISSVLHLHFQTLDIPKIGPIPSGGLVGRTLSYVLYKFFGTIGAYLIIVTLLLSSLILSIDLPVKALAKGIRRYAEKGISIIAALREFAASLRIKEGRKRIKVVEADKKKETPRIIETETIYRQEEFNFQGKRGGYQIPPLSLLDDPPPASRRATKEEVLMSSNILEKKLRDYGIEGKVIEVHPGPVITVYEFEPAPGIKVNKIVSLSDDIALAMKAITVRIVAPIPGKAAVGIEIPNNNREEVRLKDILSSIRFTESRSKLTLALGKDIFGNPFVSDLSKMPHLLVAGTTGSGKSMAINTMICSLLFNATPDEVKMLMIDPKMLELTAYDGIPYLIAPVITQPKEAALALQKVVSEMQHRYRLLASKGARNIEAYNRLIRSEKLRKEPLPGVDTEAEEGPLPYIVVIIDELADLMLFSVVDVENSIARLAQMARAAGIHLVVATQRPSVNVLTGVIKANFPARISFQVSSKIDSQTILDTGGAEQLLGKGDMLFLPPGTAHLERVHGCFVSEEEIGRIVEFVKKQGVPVFEAFNRLPVSDEKDVATADEAVERDELYDQAVELVKTTGRASASFIQRRLKVGYNRAARMIEMMEEDGIVGPAEGGRLREVLPRKFYNEEEG